MRWLPVLFALLTAAGTARADTEGRVGVVVTSTAQADDAKLQLDVASHLEAWLRKHGHTIVPSPLPSDAVDTIANCFLIDDLKCARASVEARSKADIVVFARIEPAGKDVTFTTYWFVKGHDVISERRVCEQCTQQDWHSLTDTMMKTLTSSHIATGTLHLESSPSGLIVLIDNNEVGATPYDHELPVGSHEVALTHGGEIVAHKTVEIRVGKTKRLVVETDVERRPSRLGPWLLLGGGTAVIGGGAIFLYYGLQNGKYEYPQATPVGIGMIAVGAGAAIGGAILLSQSGHSSTPIAAIAPGGGYVGWLTRF
jgi:hypothetical protein